MTSKVEMVSVVIPTLNEAGNIKEALESINKTLAFPYEIIVVDGCSTDGTLEIVKKSNCKVTLPLPPPVEGGGFEPLSPRGRGKGEGAYI